MRALGEARKADGYFLLGNRSSSIFLNEFKKLLDSHSRNGLSYNLNAFNSERCSKKEAVMPVEIITYLVYLAISIALTVWVAQTLHKNGRVFLVDVFHGNEPLADSVNHLLVVGFYLIKLGYVSLA